MVDVDDDGVEAPLGLLRVQPRAGSQSEEVAGTSRQRGSEVSDAAAGTSPRRCQSITTSSASTTTSERTSGCSRTACAV